MINDNNRIMIRRRENESKWNIITKYRYDCEVLGMNFILNNSANKYAETINCGVVYRMIRVEDKKQYKIDRLRPVLVLSAIKLNNELHSLFTPKKRKIDSHTIINSLILIILLYILFFGCSGITAPVGVHIHGTSDKTIESTFDQPEYRSYGWMIPMPEYSGASIEVRDGLVWRALPDSFYRLLAGSVETDDYWIKIEDKNHELNGNVYRVTYE